MFDVSISHLRYILKCVLFIAIMFVSHLNAQAPDTLWTKKYGSSGDDWASSVKLTVDDGFIVVGGTSSSGIDSVDVFLIKLNGSGDTVWTRQYGGSGNDGGYAIETTSDSGFIIAGYTSSYGQGNYDIWLIRTNSTGDTIWTKTFGGPNSDIGYSIQQTSDDGFIVVGSFDGGANQQVILIKINSYGDSLWTKKYGSTGLDRGFSVQQTTDGGFIITGATQSFGAGGDDVWLLKTDQFGDTSWTKTYGGVEYDQGCEVRQTSDTGYVVTGYTWSYGAGLRDIWLVKTDEQGDTIWTRTYGGANYDWGNSVKQATDRGFIIAGYTWSYGAGHADVFLVRTDSLGDTLWTKTLGYSEGDWANEVELIPDLGYIIVGTVDYDLGYGDIYIVRISPDTLGCHENARDLNPYGLLTIEPNPFRRKTCISSHSLDLRDVDLRIYDVAGQLVRNIPLHSSHTGSNIKISWDCCDNAGNILPTGIYLLNCRTRDFFISVKLILIE